MTAKPALLGNTPIFDQFVPIVRPTLPRYDDGLAREIADLLDSGMLTKGKRLEEFEKRVAVHLGVGHAVGVSSCTLGLLLTFHGLGLDKEVILPSFTFIATAHALHWARVKPVFVDIDPTTWNIDPTKAEKAITERTTAIVAVHNFGNPAAVVELTDLARRRGLKLVFDSAHGLGSQYRGTPVGRFGDAEVFSISPTKLVVGGEGGIVATDNDALADHIRWAREYGNSTGAESDFPGLNARLPEFNAILGIRTLAALDNNALRRNRLAKAYRGHLVEIPGLTLQRIDPDDRSSYKDLSVLVDEAEFGLSRDQLAVALRAENIETRKYHDPPAHAHGSYRHLGLNTAQDLTVTNNVAPRSLSLPIWSHMEDGIVDGICQAIERLQQHARAVRQRGSP